jgi:glycosyltransferase involved in cell wall biosynthesis
VSDVPRFSITIPAYNAEATLAETVASVRVQTLADLELVIVDDGSTDSTLSIAERLASEDSRIRVVSQENRGPGGAYNTAAREAKSDLLVMLSADDLLLPEHLASMSAFVSANPDAAVFTCGGWYEYEGGRREEAAPERLWADPCGCTLEDLLRACFYGVGAVYRRELWDAVGGFREDFYSEDYLFWLLALAHGFRHRHLDEALSVHRRNNAQMSADALRMRQNDLVVIETVMASGLLSPGQMEAAQQSVARLRRNIRIRIWLGRLIGSRATERLIAGSRSGRAPR